MWNRYAIYWLPDGEFGQAGSDWLGWDARGGVERAGADPATDRPRRYGFHATMKPPFRLDGTEAALIEAAKAAAAALRPVAPQPFAIRRIGAFLAIQPENDAPARVLASAMVKALDAFRVPASPEEMARRRAGGLTERQEALLMRWGYPYLMEEHRLHLTLTGPKPPADTLDRARAQFEGVLSHPHGIDRLSLAGEDAEGRFHLIRDLPLQG